MNIDTRKHLKPGPIGNQRPLGPALRQMSSERMDRVPEDMGLLLHRLDRRKR